MSYFTLLFVLFFFIYFCWTYFPLSLSFKSPIESIFETHLQATNLAQKDLHRPAKMAAQQSHFPCNGEAHFAPHVCMAYRLPQSFMHTSRSPTWPSGKSFLRQDLPAFTLQNPHLRKQSSEQAIQQPWTSPSSSDLPHPCMFLPSREARSPASLAH